MKKIFGQRLKKLRLENDELQADLATALDVDVSMVSLWENGKNFPEVAKLIEIAEYYHASIDYLLGLSNVNIIQNNIHDNHGNITFNQR